MIKKILIFSGDHPRHLYINSTFLKFKDLEFKGIVMKRESMIPKIDKKNSYLDNKNLKKHFLTRNNNEKKNFGNLNYKKIFKDIDYVECTSKTLNSKKIYNFIKKFNPDFVFIFGVDIIKEPMIYIRKQPKGFGKGKLIEGEFKRNNHSILIEDMATDAGSKLHFINALRSNKLIVNDIFVAFYYGIYKNADSNLKKMKVKLNYLATWHDIISVSHDYLSSKDQKNLEDYISSIS